jgi:hypothetical protein
MKHRLKTEVVRKEPRLVVVATAADVPIHLLETDDVGLLMLDALQHPMQ